MIPRLAESVLKQLAEKHPIVAVKGPGSSGKSTLCRTAFPEKPCISLKNPDLREQATANPSFFVAGYPQGAIINDAWLSPPLLQYLLSQTKDTPCEGSFIMTGPVPATPLTTGDRPAIGRLASLHLLPLSVSELNESALLPETIDELLIKGMFPSLYCGNITPASWYAGYISRFLDMELRQLLNIRDLSLFQRFLRSCASASGAIVNLSAMAGESGITHNTARAWLSILEMLGLVFLLRPHQKSYGKRLVKTSKLYFCDTGLAAWLLGIRDPSQVASHPLRGALFETWVVGELRKGRCNRGLEADFRFWRDNIGNEIDVLLEHGETILPIEIKPEENLCEDMFAGLRKWLSLAGKDAGRGRLVYGGRERQSRSEAAVVPWMELDSLAERL